MREATLADKAMVERWLLRDEGKAVDFSGFFAQPNNVCLIEGDGGALFGWHSPGIYEVHVAFEQRGKDVIALSHRMLDYMRETHGALLFWSYVPVERRRVVMFTRLMGWKSRGRTGANELFISE